MLLKNPFIYIILVLASASAACNRYIDAVAKEDKLPKTVGYLAIYPDSNVFSYKASITLTRDKEKIYPRSFKIALPKDLKYYEVVGSTHFVFYYNNNQSVMVVVDLEDSTSVAENGLSYIPKADEIDQIIQSKLTLTKSKFDIKRIPLNAKYKQLVVKRKWVTFLLYNIAPRNYDLFVNYLSSFSWQL